MMKYLLIIWYWAIMNYPRYAMSLQSFTTPTAFGDDSVPVWKSMAHPFPTGRIHMRHSWTVFINEDPKSLLNRLAWFAVFNSARLTSKIAVCLNFFTAINTWMRHKNTPFNIGCSLVTTQLSNAKRGLLNNNSQGLFEQLFNCVVVELYLKMGIYTRL